MPIDHNEMMDDPESLSAPNLLWAMAEPSRAAFEASMLPWSMGMLAKAPSGDGHPVLVLPGFTASDVSTAPMRQFLRRKGYAVHPWRLGRNLGPIGDIEPQIHGRLQDLAEEYGEKVSIIGWSLGGIYAREVARAFPDLTRQVITLGSPFGGAAQGCNVVWAYDALTGEKIRERPNTFFRMIKEPPPVPSTAIYSKSDGIAAWQTCIEMESNWTDNIEVVGSHCGLGFNPVVYYAIADRLALPEEEWCPFDRSGWRRVVYR